MQGIKGFMKGLYLANDSINRNLREDGLWFANRPFLLIVSFIGNGLIIHYFNGTWYAWAFLAYINLVFIDALFSYIGEYIYREESGRTQPDFKFKPTTVGQELLIIIYFGLTLALSGFREAFGAPHSNRPFLLILFYVANGFVFHYFGEIRYDWILLLVVSILYISLVLSYIGEYIYHKSKEETE